MRSLSERKEARQMDKPQNGQVRMGAETRWRGSYGNCSENLEEIGWGIIPNLFGESENLCYSKIRRSLIYMRSLKSIYDEIISYRIAIF